MLLLCSIHQEIWLKGQNGKQPLYIDERATQEQKDAITKIYSGQAGGFFTTTTNLIGEMLGVKSIPIEFDVDGKHRKT